ncbi:YraN family protein [Clostridium sp. SYSU_GA19001]|uniref:YraN family protein n=1 Tax=Clostridium caldaquaticum TaxID=2940653 RepID=UPI0020770523|nr:YraN family protein [Clostridium caldaquaticum]MCM8710609.1 YraN family protein [Clostridium caldaquaticum]
MKSLNKNIGFYGEDIAANYLKNLGYIIFERNFRCYIGEIDIIGKDNTYIVFVEVKTRYDNNYGTPAESVTYSKQRKIYKTAQYYILKNNIHKLNFRFDVIEIILNDTKNAPTIRLIKNAFQI